MINYFRELLATLKRIEKHLETIASTVSSNGQYSNYINTSQATRY